MLRQLARLTRRVPAAGPRALAIAIYADSAGALVAADGEGVACVDDAARGVELLAAVWEKTRAPRIKQWADGLFDFVRWMHVPDGTCVNFIGDWSGGRNTEGITSEPGINFWQARALGAAVSASVVLGNQHASTLVESSLAAAAANPAPPDIRALHLLALQRWLDSGRGGEAERALTGRWADEIASVARGDVLMNSRSESGTPHLWGHVQEAALARVGVARNRRDLVQVAEAGAMALLAPAIESGFDQPRVQPYDVQSAIEVMDALTAATQEVGYAQLATSAREWFDGRNPSGLPVYDRAAGRVADGVDDGQVSRNSGAESNVVGGLALLDDAIAGVAAR